MINKTSQLLYIDFGLSRRSMCYCCLHPSCVGAKNILKKRCCHQKLIMGCRLCQTPILANIYETHRCFFCCFFLVFLIFIFTKYRLPDAIFSKYRPLVSNFHAIFSKHRLGMPGCDI